MLFTLEEILHCEDVLAFGIVGFLVGTGTTRAVAHN